MFRKAALVSCLVLVCSITVSAQTSRKSSTSKKTSSKAKVEKSKYHRLPTYYGQLKLKEAQVAEIYKLRDSYGPKIDELQTELTKLKEKQAEDIKDVLTRTQVTALNKLKAGTASKSSSSKSSKSSSSKKK